MSLLGPEHVFMLFRLKTQDSEIPYCVFTGRTCDISLLKYILIVDFRLFVGHEYVLFRNSFAL